MKITCCFYRNRKKNQVDCMNFSTLSQLFQYHVDVTIVKIVMTLFSKCFSVFKPRNNYVSLCASSCCFSHLDIIVLFYCIPLLHFFGGRRRLFLEMTVSLKSTVLFDLASCLQLPIRDLDSLVMAKIQVLFLFIFVACSEFCQSHSSFDLSSAIMVVPY